MDEPLVKAVMVPVKELCSSLVPLHVLNKEIVLTDDRNGEFAKKDFHPDKVEVEDAVQSLLLPRALLCSSAAPLISVLLPNLTCQQKAELVQAACQDLSDLVIHQPFTLEALFPGMKQDLANVVSTTNLASLSQTKAGTVLLTSLLPWLSPQKLALLASHLLDNRPPAFANLISILLPLVDSQSVTFGLLSEAVLGNFASQAEDHHAALVNQLLEFEDKDVAARVDALQI